MTAAQARLALVLAIALSAVDAVVKSAVPGSSGKANVAIDKSLGLEGLREELQAKGYTVGEPETTANFAVFTIVW